MTDVKQYPGADRAVWSSAAPALALTVAGIMVTGALVWFQMLDPARAEHSARLAGAAADHHAGLVDARIVELRAQLAAAAAADIATAALISGEQAQLDQAGRQLTQIVPFADRVEVIPSGSASVDLNAAVPISYAALRVIRAAETEGFVGPEGVRLDNQDSRFFAAGPIDIDGATAGVLFVALSSEYLLQPLKAFHRGGGRATLTQTFDGSQPLALLRWGETEAGGPGAVVRRPLAVPHWHLEFEPGPPPATPLLGMGQLATALAAGLGLALAGLLLMVTGLARKLRQAAPAPPLRVDPSEDAFAAPGMRPLIDGSPAVSPGPTPFLGEGSGGAGDPAQPQADAGAAVPDDPPAAVVSSTRKPFPDDFLYVSAADDDENFGIEVIEDTSPLATGLRLEPQIFRAYDIRGISSENLTEEVVYWIGRAFAAEALDQQQRRAAVGRDGRHSSLPLRDALVRGLTEGGVDVLDVGQVPTPVLYFATHALDTGTGIMITGSHNPPEYNGLKMMIAGETLAEDRIQQLRARIEENRLSTGDADVEQVDVSAQYLNEIVGDVVVAQQLKVVVDCGNGVAGRLAPELISQLGCEVIPLYCDVDGDFPNHHPDPAEAKNLQDLITVVAAEQADLGLAFDGDGDRIGVVSGSGAIIWPDKLLMLFAQDVVGRNPGADIIYDVKCSRHLNTLIGDLGGRPIMWKTGHSHMKAKLKETGALLAGEFSGHICFGERWYGFDDALYAAARLLEIVGGADDSVDALFARFPTTFSTPELKVATTEEAKFQVMERLITAGDFGAGTVTAIDGLRVDYPEGWGLIRPSNTSPVLTLRFEADSEEALERLQALFAEQLSAADPQLRFR